MAELLQLLPQIGVPAGKTVLDLTLARGLDYYTGPVFEAKVTEPKVGRAGGGRYEGLIGTFGSRPVSATGVSLGLERIIEVVRDHGTCHSDRGRAGIRARGRSPSGSGRRSDQALLRRNQNRSIAPGREESGRTAEICWRRGIGLAAILGPNEAERVWWRSRICRPANKSKSDERTRSSIFSTWSNHSVIDKNGFERNEHTDQMG